MKLPEPSRRELPENLIPLINIVFLLLIFFMVAGAIEAIDAFEVEAPESVSETQLAEDSWTLLVAADGRLAIDDEVFDIDVLEERVRAMTAASDAAVIAERSDVGMDAGAGAIRNPVRVKIERFAESDLLLDVLESLRRAGIERVVLVTEQE